jgi:outer membrane protein assembly factor BamD
MQQNIIKLLITIIFAALLLSCSKDEKKPTAESSYIAAMKSLKDRNYSEAAKNFEKIDDDFPFSKWAVKAGSMAAYAYYKEKEYSDVIRVVDDFIRINPTNQNIPYMFYMKALSYYEQIPEITRAQDATRQASATFRELIARFPTSEYADDAKEKLVFVDEHLAGAKMSVGRYQILQQNYVGAIESFQDVVTRYSYTNQAPEAYYRLYEIYQKLGLKTESLRPYQILKTKFPDSKWASRY